MASKVDVNVGSTVPTINSSMDVVIRLFAMDRSIILRWTGWAGPQSAVVDDIITKPISLK